LSRANIKGEFLLTDSKVVIIDGGYASYAYEQKVLGNAGHRIDIFQGDRHDRQGRIKFSQGAIGLLYQWTKIDTEILDGVPTVKAVVRYGAGFDNVDLTAASERNVKVANVTKYANHSVSDHALALMFACTRALPLGEKKLRTRYLKPPRQQIFEFKDKTLGVVGLGSIGETLCKKAKSLFKRMLAYDPYLPKKRFNDLGVIKTDLKSLLAESHVISLHCNLTEETTRLINGESFRRMVQRPILINTSRGPLLDYEALLTALNNGQIHSVGLDVYWEEPPSANRDELLSHPHVIATGHYAWYSEEAMIELQKRATNNMLKLLQGKIPEDCLNP